VVHFIEGASQTGEPGLGYEGPVREPNGAHHQVGTPAQHLGHDALHQVVIGHPQRGWYCRRWGWRMGRGPRRRWPHLPRRCMCTMFAFGNHRGGRIFFSGPGGGCHLERRRAADGVGAPGVRAVYNGCAEGGYQLRGISDIKVNSIAVPPLLVDDVIARNPSRC
jgi:hypothetical protein